MHSNTVSMPLQAHPPLQAPHVSWPLNLKDILETYRLVT